MIGVIFMPSTFTHFITILIGAKKNKSFIFLNYLISLFLSATVYSSLFARIGNSFLVFPYWPLPGRLFPIHLTHFFINLLYSYPFIFKTLKENKGIFRAQIRYVLLGTGIGFLGGLTNYFCWYRIAIPPFLNISASLAAPIITYAIIKYHLMDIRIALTRTGIFAVVYSLVLIIPFIIAKYFQPLFYDLLGNNWWLPILIIGMVLATIGPFIYQYLRRRAEDVILKDQRRYQRALRELSKTMTRIRDLDKLLRMIVLTVVDTVKVSYAGIYLKEEEYKSYGLKHCYPKKEQSHFQEFIPLDSPLIKTLYQQKRPLIHEEISSLPNLSLDSGLVIPCFMEDELLGFLIMGAKPENQIYTSDDMLVFETLSYSTSLAIENCRFWKEIEDRQRKARLQEIDNYSYSLAHEIDNPMQVILGEAGFLKKFFLEEISLPEEKQKEAQEMLDFILEAAQRVSAMVKAIREFGQKTSGKFKPLNIADVAESFARLYYPQFKDKNVIFEKTLDLKAPVFVLGEKPELMQVLVILANNSIHAMKYSQEKRISLKIEQPNSLLVRISFTDTGCGIKKELLPIIFSPFTTTKASSEGTGMGLYNAKKIIDRHKGKIWAESEGENMGATFFIELPIAKDVKSEELEERDKDKRLF
jgi:signal transduction histidine kinase